MTARSQYAETEEAGAAGKDDPERRRRCDREYRVQLLLHGHIALHVVVLRQGQGEGAGWWRRIGRHGQRSLS